MIKTKKTKWFTKAEIEKNIGFIDENTFEEDNYDRDIDEKSERWKTILNIDFTINVRYNSISFHSSEADHCCGSQIISRFIKSTNIDKFNASNILRYSVKRLIEQTKKRTLDIPGRGYLLQAICQVKDQAWAIEGLKGAGFKVKSTWINGNSGNELCSLEMVIKKPIKKKK